MDRATRCIVGIVGFGVVRHRYFSGGFSPYARLLYSGERAVARGKSETFSVEGNGAEIRHSLSTRGGSVPNDSTAKCRWSVRLPSMGTMRFLRRPVQPVEHLRGVVG